MAWAIREECDTFYNVVGGEVCFTYAYAYITYAARCMYLYYELLCIYSLRCLLLGHETG